MGTEFSINDEVDTRLHDLDAVRKHMEAVGEAYIARLFSIEQDYDAETFTGEGLCSLSSCILCDTLQLIIDHERLGLEFGISKRERPSLWMQPWDNLILNTFEKY